MQADTRVSQEDKNGAQTCVFRDNMRSSASASSPGPQQGLLGTNGGGTEAAAAASPRGCGVSAPKDIDGAIDLRRTGGGGDRATYVDACSRLLGLNNCFYFVVGRGGASAGLGCRLTALSFLDRGIAFHVCIMGAVTDWSRWRRNRARPEHRGMAHGEKAGYWGKALGDLRAVEPSQLDGGAPHGAVYGTTSRQLGAISVAERAWACKNPEAQMYGRPITVEDHPEFAAGGGAYHLLDISLVSDGGVAFILTTADRAKDRPQAAGLRAGPGFRRSVGGLVVGQEELHPHGGAARAKQQAFGPRPSLELSSTSIACSLLRLLHCRGALPARGLRLPARRAKAAPSWDRAPSGPARQHHREYQRRPALLLSFGRSHRHGGGHPPSSRRRGRAAWTKRLQRGHDNGARWRG